MADHTADPRNLKQQIRAQARANRRDQANKDALSRQICRTLAASSEYTRAAVVMFYVDFRHEVRTRPFLAEALKQDKQIVVPYCVGEQLELFRLAGIDELEEAAFGILEPKPELRGRVDRKIDVRQLDLIVVPGVAFDRHGGRLGHGKGYYDRLLRQVPADTPLVALAFECQIFPEIPMLPHDVYVNKVITETAVYQRQARP